MKLRRGARLADERSPTDPTTAWYVGEGDVLYGGAQVVAVQRDAVKGTVRILTNDSHDVTLDRNKPVEVVRRAL